MTLHDPNAVAVTTRVAGLMLSVSDATVRRLIEADRLDGVDVSSPGSSRPYFVVPIEAINALVEGRPQPSKLSGQRQEPTHATDEGGG